MSINVICPGCHTRFKVSDRFAGRSGACPKCKSPIQVPTADQEIKVHTPEQYAHGGRAADGRLALKPIERNQAKFSLVPAISILAITVAAFVVAWLAGSLLREYWLFRAAALLLISPPLVWAGYLFLRDDDSLEMFSGNLLLIRTAICAMSYAALWAVFGYASPHVLTGEVWNWLIAAPPFIITGALVSLACYDLDFGNGCFHYAFYLLVTILLRACAGMGWIWQIGL
ncbi:MAG: hypothetical protein JW888_15410 [Pirellulales bacterium]|nr:hypothetical protein [Pirellulales bacterium]